MFAGLSPDVTSSTATKIVLTVLGTFVFVWLWFTLDAPVFREGIFLLIGAVVVFILPSVAQFTLLLITLHLPSGFDYTTTNIVGLDVQLSDLLVAVLLIRISIVLVSDNVRVNDRLRTWVLFVIAFVLWSGIAQTVSALRNPEVPIESWVGWLRVSSYLLLVPVFGMLTSRLGRFERFISLALWLIVAQAVFGMFLKFFGPQIGISVETIDLISGTKNAVRFGTTEYGVTGLLGSVSAFGVASSVFVALWLSRTIDGSKGSRYNAGGITSLIVLLTAVALSTSRRAILGTAAGMLLVFVSSREGLGRRGLSVALLIMALLVFVGPGIQKQLEKELFLPANVERSDTSLGGRLLLWEESVGFIESSPVFGVGWSMFGRERGLPGTFSHSSYTETAIAFGIPGLLLLMLGILLVVRDSLFLIRRGGSLTWMGTGTLGATTAVLIAAIFGELLLTGEGRFFWVVVGLQLCAVRIASRSETREEIGVPQNRGIGRETVTEQSALK